MNPAFSLKTHLKQQAAIGIFCRFHDMAVTEMVARAGFDFLVLDREHANFSGLDVENIIRVAEGLGIGTVVRLANPTKEDVLHALDSGADGVQIPNLSDVETARMLCESAKYYPLGTRGASTTQRASHYGCWDAANDYFEHANDNTLVVVHVENKELAADIEALCAIPQLDVVFVGPADLSQSLGKPGQMDDPAVTALIADIFQKTLAAGKAVGIYAGSAAQAKKYLDMGADYLAYMTDTVCLATTLRQRMGELGDAREG